MSLTKRYWKTGVIAVVLFSCAAVWIFLPNIACWGVQYDWSRGMSMDILEWLGPRAAGYVWEYHENFTEDQWHGLARDLIRNVATDNDADLFVSSFRDLNVRGYEGRTPLYLAVAHGTPGLLEFLLKSGADINARNDDGETPLFLAAEECYPSRRFRHLMLLLEYGADVNARNDGGFTAMEGLDRMKNQRAVHILRKHGCKTGAELDAEKQTPLP